MLEKKLIVQNDKAKISAVIKELDQRKNETLRVTHEKVTKDFGSIFGTLLPGATAQLSPPEGGTVLDGLEVRVSFDPQRNAEENAAEMRDVLDAIATGEVTVASRDAQLNGLAVPKGSFLGLADGEAIAVGESFDEVARQVVDRLLAEPRGMLTLLRGEEAPDLDALVASLAKQHPDVEVDVQEGGQPHYPLLLSACSLSSAW